MRDTQDELPRCNILKINTRLLGNKGEEIAVSYLKKEGYKIAGRNYRTSRGEIDIVAYDSDKLVFIEVKTRRSSEYGEGQWAIDTRKQKRMIKVALTYMVHKKVNGKAYRFDTVIVEDHKDDGCKVVLIKDAFQADGSEYNV